MAEKRKADEQHVPYEVALERIDSSIYFSAAGPAM